MIAVIGIAVPAGLGLMLTCPLLLFAAAGRAVLVVAEVVVLVGVAVVVTSSSLSYSLFVSGCFGCRSCHSRFCCLLLVCFVGIVVTVHVFLSWCVYCHRRWCGRCDAFRWSVGALVAVFVFVCC